MSGDDFWKDFKKQSQAFHSLFQELFPSIPSMGEASMYWKPFIDMYEADDKLVVVVDIAGVEPNDVKLKIKGNYLYIEGVRKPFEETSRTRLNYYEMEIRFGKFERIVPLPYEVDRENIKVNTKNGLLKIEFIKLNSTERIIPIE